MNWLHASSYVASGTLPHRISSCPPPFLQALKARRSRSVATSPSVPRHPHTSHHDHDPETNIWRNPRGSLDSDDGYTASSAATSSTPLSSLPSTQDTSLPTSSIASHEHDPGAAARVLGRAAAGWRDEADAPPPSVLPNEASELVTLVGYADRAAAADAELARSRGTSPGRPAAPAPVAGEDCSHGVHGPWTSGW